MTARGSHLSGHSDALEQFVEPRVLPKILEGAERYDVEPGEHRFAGLTSALEPLESRVRLVERIEDHSNVMVHHLATSGSLLELGGDGARLCAFTTARSNSAEQRESERRSARQACGKVGFLDRRVQLSQRIVVLREIVVGEREIRIHRECLPRATHPLVDVSRKRVRPRQLCGQQDREWVELELVSKLHRPPCASGSRAQLYSAQPPAATRTGHGLTREPPVRWT